MTATHRALVSDGPVLPLPLMLTPGFETAIDPRGNFVDYERAAADRYDPFLQLLPDDALNDPAVAKARPSTRSTGICCAWDGPGIDYSVRDEQRDD